MSLPLLNWKFVGTRVIPNPGGYSGTLPWALNTIYTLGVQTTYADGSARVPGTGSAWTWARDGVGGSCVAAYAVPALTTAVGMKYIFAGDNSTTSYTKLFPDTSVTSGHLLVGMNKNSGAYAGWATATPFTTASSFSGYWRMVVTYPGAHTVSMWESQEACMVSVGVNGGNTYSAQIGALYDPLTYTPGVTCETDNRLYYITTSGGTLSKAFLTSTTATQQAFTATPGTTSPRCGYFDPGGVLGVQYAYRGGTWTPSTTFVNPADRLTFYPFWAQNANGQFLGAARNFFISRDSLMCSTLMNGTSQVGHVFGADLFGNGDTVILGT